MERLQYNRDEHAAEVVAAHYGRQPAAYVRSFGCQQNVNDTERLVGVLLDLGYAMVDSPQQADLVLFNTCAVREHAEQRVYGNLGALKALKQKRNGVLIGLCGCMGVEKTTIDKLRESYPFVDIVLGTNAADQLPSMLVEKMTTRKKALRVPPIGDEQLTEGVPLVRQSSYRAFLPITFGCDNYCSYCIVPYVRGRERSRTSADILAEFKGLVDAGYKEITLLGQNVNSYGKGNDEKMDFSDLLALLCTEAPGDYKLRFMTSHPKDATRKMIDTICAYPQLCNHLHLPVQSGSNEILALMNRRYTAEDYLGLIRYAKEQCPEMTFSSDIMVGYPGETEADFEKTMELVREVGYTQLFTFIYSKRPGTAAAEQPDLTDHKAKADRIQRLLDLQEEMVAGICTPWTGRVFTGLVEDAGRTEGTMQARLDNNMLVEFAAQPGCEGSFVDLKITGVRGAMLDGVTV
ncbi:tRNA (N6-isopentenyl adenosine(37)-C2)-methylthiotransferase MiaB [Ruminococcaceae bacterium OttesenSCG-928-D13]|nr:tRNA (N6-isopentenyl adenosine(37)-C2)-methylthiotransferase MiaB [Ruminococcaceae bacterium OttesenSCG-928-D13]